MNAPCFTVSRRAQALHTAALVVDGHMDTLLHLLRGNRPSLGQRSDQGHADLVRLREGGVKVQFFPCYIEPEYKPDRAVARFLQYLDLFHREMAAHAEVVEPAFSAADVERITASGKLAAILALEGGEPVVDLAALRVYHRLGLRSVGLVWNQRNHIADGMAEARTGGGLTTFGVELVREMNRLGILVDVSHLADPGFWHVLELSTRPVAATHSNARALCPHPRNLTDDQIKALARNGGVMGVNFAPAFVHPEPEKAGLDRVLDHIDHVCGLVGPDHVGLGSDFDGIPSAPAGLEDATTFPRLTQGLLDRGYDETAVRKILGLNFLRVIREAIG